MFKQNYMEQADCARAAAKNVGAARVRLLFVLALAGLAAACTGASQTGSALTATGDEHGGKVPYSEGGVQAAGDAARAHCSRFGKKAQITQMQPAEGGGGTIGFQCR
jgi:hypothetical protein